MNDFLDMLTVVGVGGIFYFLIVAIIDHYFQAKLDYFDCVMHRVSEESEHEER